MYLGGGFGELRFRIALYCAWHLGKDVASRRGYYETLKKLYAIASDAVHGRGIKDAKASKDILAAAQDLCREGILRRLKEDRQPEWDELVLGGGGGEDQ